MRSATTAYYYKQAINLVLDYIHAHLSTTLNLKEVAQIANMSPFHFHRMFKEQVGEPPDQYIRRLRLERAALLLQTFDLSLAQVAQKTGYRTQQSLSKAFKRHFGESPKVFRKKSLYPLKNQPALSTPKLVLTPSIRQMEETHLVYLRVVGPYGVSLVYDAAWQNLMNHANQKGLLNEKTGYLGLSLDDPAITSESQCRFYACITTKAKVKSEGDFGSLTLNAGIYAVFLLKGPYEQLYDLYQTIYLHWLPASGRRLRAGLPFEKYLNSPDQVRQEELLTEVWIPVSND